MKALLIIIALVGAALVSIPFWIVAPGQLEVRCQDQIFHLEMKGLQAKFTLPGGASLLAPLQADGNSGRAVVGPLEPGQVTVSVQVPGYKLVQVSAEIESLKVAVADVKLEPTFGALMVSAVEARKRGNITIASPLDVKINSRAVKGDPQGILVLPLPPGKCEVKLAAKGYCPTVINAEVVAGKVVPAVVFMNPVLTGKELVAVVMGWGPHPRDLDLHLFLPSTPGLTNKHVYFPARHMKATLRNKQLIASLDVDNRKAEGPETITLFQGVNGKYMVGVYHFAGDENIARSNGYVTIYTKGCQSRVFRPPASCDKKWWYVCDLQVKGEKVTITPASQCQPKKWRTGSKKPADNPSR